MSIPIRPFPRLAVAPSLLLASLAVMVSAGGCAPDAPVEVAYVAVGGNNHVRVVDLDSGETLRKVYSGPAPWRLVLEPGGERLWIQHWYSGTTAVLDLESHEIEELLPFRGPGAFDGTRFETFDWPEPTLYTIDSTTLAPAGERLTGVREVYDLGMAPGGGLVLAQYDPVSRGPVPRYGYVLSYDHRAEDPDAVSPVSRPTGASPVDVVPVPGQPFLLTADRGTNGLTLLNELGDRRALAVCRGPRRVVLSRDTHRMAVVCWEEAGRHLSEVLVFDADFAARPWPTLEKRAETAIPGGLVAADFDAAGERLFAVDRTGGRLLELDAASLELVREIPVGDAPTDVVVAALPRGVRDGLAAGDGESRRLLRQALERMRGEGSPVRELAWTETISWFETPPAEEEETQGEDAAPPEPVENSRTLRVALRAPDAMRTETTEGGVRLAAGGHSLSLDRDGRFWVTPRQDLAAVVYLLPTLPVDEAIRQLAGDVPGSPFLRTGIAVDLVSEVNEDGHTSWVVGARPEGDRVAQLWIDAETGRPTNLVEQFPVFGGSGHGGGAPEIAETKFYDFRPVARGLSLPTRLERIVQGEWLQHARLDAFAPDPGLPPESFDPALLAGVEPAGLFAPAATALAADGLPGLPLPLDLPPEPVVSPLAPYAPYRTSPPTSGPYLPYAAEWGVHPIPVPLPLQVHTLLDGGVALLYRCPGGCPELQDRLGEVAAQRDFVLVAPYPWMDSKLALAAWGRLEMLDGYDAGRVEAFLDAWAGKDHHGDLPGAEAVAAH